MTCEFCASSGFRANCLSTQWFARISGRPMQLKTLDWIQMFGLERNMRILDVGSGGAFFVRAVIQRLSRKALKIQSSSL